MNGPKIGLVGLPFHLWRSMLNPNLDPSGIELLRATHRAIGQQVGLQSFHVNCGLPSFTLRREPEDRRALVCTCDCGEDLTIVSNLHPDFFEKVGPQGIYVPRDHDA